MAAEIEKQFSSIDAANKWDLEFMNLKRRCDQESRDKQHTLDASKTLDNRRNNRYRDVNPYDHSRIVLARSAATDTDYINANLVKCERADRQYILTQGPLPLTVSHFWLMVWEQRSKAILMLNKLIEKKAIKCHKYWPEEIGVQYKMHLSDVQLTVEYVKYEQFDHFSIRTLLLHDQVGGETREVLQFHYTTWPDFGIPSSPNDFLRFLKMVRDSGAMAKSVGPVIVHCSAGIGRSGTFCLVDCCLTMLEEEKRNNKAAEEDASTTSVSVSDVLSELRSYRMGLIQTPDQLFFSYRAIIDGVKYFNDEDWCHTPISSTIKYCEGEENGAGPTEDDEAPPPLPPPRTESLTNNNNNNNSKGESPLPPLPAGREESAAEGQWSVQQPLPMIPIEERDDDEEEKDVDGSESETDVESCHSVESNGEGERMDEEEEEENVTTNITKKMKVAENGESEEHVRAMDVDEMMMRQSVDGGEGAEDQNATERDTLRRRVAREEKQQLMADKVKDIKRKQREMEEGVVASKKRRSIDDGEDDDNEESEDDEDDS